MVKNAWQKWEELERAANTDLVTLTGAIDFAPRDSDAFRQLVETCEENKISYKIYNHEEIGRKVPGFSTPANYGTIYTERGGIIRASKSVATLQSQAVKNGAKIIDEYALSSVKNSGGSLEVTLDSNRIGKNGESFKKKISCKKLIVCPGAWLTPVAKKLFDVNINTQVFQMGYYYFDTVGADRDVYSASKFPVFIDYNDPDAHVYGTPAFEYPSLLKVGSHGERFQTHTTTAVDR